ncbi:hypothetical protein [Streptomyces lushanensis]|uniref:hypothetical protein n=1 Tax=Streptomyces lushanensis TaxID=1434255 RepID=UPI001474F4F5|nr:hypothetical protein [Streptomyces lushanensis]
MIRFWTLLAVLFAALTVGALATTNRNGGIDDLAVAVILGCLAWGSWKARRR